MADMTSICITSDRPEMPDMTLSACCPVRLLVKAHSSSRVP